MESTDLIPMEADVAKITKRAEEFKDLPDALQRNLQTFLTLTMDILAVVHQKVKASSLPEVSRQMVRGCVMGSVEGLCTDTLADHRLVAQKVEGAHYIRGEPQVPDVARRVFVPGTLGRRDCSLVVVVPSPFVSQYRCSRFLTQCTVYWVLACSLKDKSRSY